MSQVISLRLSHADAEALQAQAQTAQLKTGTLAADIIHAHLQAKAVCMKCGDPTLPGLKDLVTDYRATAKAVDDLHNFLRGRQFAGRKAARR